ncbi:hypothetical protein [Streptomyces sp. SR-10]|uniref:hypothetical protein n=1 Tax=Streptomyces sp. SR-10 TaxID=3416442 RepID=UPI003CEDD75F
MSEKMPRRFHLQRAIDVTGVSGTGHVADGVLWPDGTASVRWAGERTSIVFWDGGMADAEAVHGHGGATVIVWDDPEIDALRALLERKGRELKEHHLNARIGDLQGTRIQEIREVLDGWAPEAGTSLHALWSQVKAATEAHQDSFDRVFAESDRSIPGIDLEGEAG